MALLADDDWLVATQAAFLYAQRRARRMLPKVALGGALLTGIGVAAATVAAGLGAVGLAGGAAAWYRYRTKRRDTLSPQPDSWGATGFGTPVAATGPKAPERSKNDG